MPLPNNDDIITNTVDTIILNSNVNQNGLLKEAIVNHTHQDINSTFGIKFNLSIHEPALAHSPVSNKSSNDYFNTSAPSSFTLFVTEEEEGMIRNKCKIALTRNENAGEDKLDDKRLKRDFRVLCQWFACRFNSSSKSDYSGTNYFEKENGDARRQQYSLAFNSTEFFSSLQHGYSLNRKRFVIPISMFIIGTSIAIAIVVVALGKVNAAEAAKNDNVVQENKA